MAPPPGILEVRCAGCGETLEVEHGLMEFACPDCGVPQALPPELMPRRPRRALPLPGRGAPSAAPVRVACGGCGAVLSVPHGVGRFGCPLCGAELAASPAAAVSVVAPPAAVPITSNRPPKPSEIVEQVRDGPSSQPAHAGKVQMPIHSEHTHKQHPKHSFREEPFSSFRADTRTQIPVVGRLRNEPANPSVHRDELHTEPLDVTVAKPGKKKSRFAVGPKSCQAGKVQEEHPNQAVHALQAQGMPSNSSVRTDQAEGGFPDDTNTMHNKQKADHVAVPSAIEHEQISSLHQVVHEQLAGEIPSDVVHADQVQVDFSCKAIGNNKKSAKDPKRNQKRKNNSLMNCSNEWSHLRRSKRLAKGSPDLIDAEPIQKIDASPNQNQSEAPRIERTIADPDPSSPTWYRCPQAGSNELENVDATTPPTLNTLQTERFIHSYNQMYPPDTRWALPNPSSNSWGEHEIHQESFNGIDQLDRNDEEVHSNASENQNMDGQVAQEACSGKDHSEQVRLNAHSNSVAENGGQKRNGFIGSSSNDGEHPGDWSSSGARHQINFAASCSRLAPLLLVPAATTLPTIISPSSPEKLPLNCSTTTMLHHQPRSPLYSQDARCGDMLSGSVSESAKKRRGRAPAVLMEPRKEAYRPVLTPNGTDNWNVHPSCPKVATTLSLLVKQNYPGTYLSADTDGKPCELVVYHWHQCPSDVRATVLDEFLKRYKWSPGQEEECQKIFDRKAVRQLVNLFCYEKQKVREELAAKTAKRSSAVGRASGEMALEEEDGREDSEEQQGDESVVVLEHDDPLKWKPFVPEWMQPKWWEMLCDHWAKDEVMKVSYQKRKNRNAGNHPCNAAGSRSIAMHQQLMSMDNGRKLDIDPFTKIHSGKGQLVGKKALQTEDTAHPHTEEARDTQLGPHPVQEQVGSSMRGRYHGAPGVSKKAQIDSLPKSSPGCFSKQGQQPMFTQEQVQQMINQALQGLNETWEKKFLSLEQNMRNMSSSRVVPVGAKRSLVAVAGDKQCQLARQDTLDSVDGEKDPAARDEGENQDDDERWN